MGKARKVIIERPLPKTLRQCGQSQVLLICDCRAMMLPMRSILANICLSRSALSCFSFSAILAKLLNSCRRVCMTSYCISANGRRSFGVLGSSLEGRRGRGQ